MLLVPLVPIIDQISLLVNDGNYDGDGVSYLPCLRLLWQKKQKGQPLERIIPWWLGLSAKDTGEVEAAKTGHVWPHRKTQELDNQMTPPSNFFDPTRALGFHMFHMRPEKNINIFRFPPIPSSFQIVNLHFFWLTVLYYFVGAFYQVIYSL